ncbi:MAG: DNA topoisomerase IV [Cytophagaceae bacterium]|nr:DNA topoisomerase IV [Cytophagaceae bacterium]|tara:strand:- start:1149 stop:1682 length:534 start_codon:yes stop_codon:yes gene_type:complete
MKKLLVIALTLLMTSFGHGQDKFEKFVDMTGVSSLSMKPKLFKLAAKLDLNTSDPEMQSYIDLVDNLETINMYTSKDTGIMQQMRSEVNSYLKETGMEELMRVKHEDKNAKFFYKPGKNDDFVKEFFMFIDGNIDNENRVVIFKLTGNIDLNQVAKLANDLNFPGGDKLKNVEGNEK